MGALLGFGRGREDRLGQAKSWFEIMPKTMPMIFIGNRRLGAATITRMGWGATIVVSLALFALAWSFSR